MLTVQAQPDYRRHHLGYPTTDRHYSSPLSFTTSHLPHHHLPFSPSSPSSSSEDDYSNKQYLRNHNYYLTADNLDTFNNSFLDTDPATADSLMTSAYAFQGPAIRIQQSTPVPQLPQSLDTQPSMLAAANNRSWDMYGGNALATNNPSLQSSYNKRSTNQLHQRALSSSSMGSSNSSQYPSHTNATAASYYSGVPENSPPSSSVKVESSYGADQAATVPFSNHLPTPSQTPTSDSFLSPATFQTFGQQGTNYDNTMAAHINLKQMMENEDDVPGYSHSSRQSVSSYGNNSPATPRTVAGDDFDDKFKNGGFFSDKVETWMDEYLRFDDSDLVPDMKMEGTTPDSFQSFYANAAVPRLQTQHPQPTKSSMLSPYRSVMAERLQAAQMARSQSPTSATSRAVSPFRNGSPLAPVNNSFGSPRQRFGAPQMRDQANEAAVKAFALKNHAPQNQGPEPKTISPKDALLDYNENEDDSKMPLFPAEEANKFGQQFPAANNYDSLAQNFDASSEQSFASMATSRGDSWAEPRNFGSSYATAAPAQSTFNFAPPSIPGSLPVNNGMTFNSSQYRPAPMVLQQETTPEFPAHLTSMESSASENGPQESSDHSDVVLQKPGPSTASTGTYSCTYHGCPLRFETPQKLQKHKREGHRQNPSNVTVGVGSGMSADELLARNSQAGPHKCERINPTTGKPCNTIFSRPYDLTRHEDTIHNARKQKVRCALCVEEKTFSRSDALTRHMRVVHPEVDFPGKHRRRGHSSHE